MGKYRVNEIKLNPGQSEDLLKEAVHKKILKTHRRIGIEDIKSVEIVRRSFDGRGDRVKKVYTVDFICDKKINLPEPKTLKYDIPVLGDLKLNNRPIIVGFGPCGIFCGLVLARAGLKPLILERGLDVDSRIEKVERFWKTGELDTECNVQFGEGGAGTFSDGKLNTGIKDPRVRFVLETFVGAGANSDILIDARPHIGTDALRSVVKNIREEIISLGGEIRFGTRVEEIVFEEVGDAGQVKGVVVSRAANTNVKDTGEKETMETDTVVLAVGHSARDTMRTLHSQGLAMEPKPFSMGVRVEHPQELIDRGLYGEDAGHPDLPPAYYKLSTKVGDGRGVYSFCMCPGGEIVNAASQEGGVVTNGMSNSKRDSGFANSGILVDVRPEDYLSYDGESKCPPELKGIAFQEEYEGRAFINGGGTYAIPTTTWGQYAACLSKTGPASNLGESESVATKGVQAVVDSLPDFVAQDIFEAMPVFGRRIKGFDNPDTVIKAIESRSSSPVRIIRDARSLEGFFTEQTLPITGFYPGGEGAGYAGGITSAACDGIKIAEKIISAISSIHSATTEKTK